MTTATQNELQTLAKPAADHITKLNGESDTFEVETENFTACINYKAEIDEDKEATDFLQKMLN